MPVFPFTQEENHWLQNWATPREAADETSRKRVVVRNPCALLLYSLDTETKPNMLCFSRRNAAFQATVCGATLLPRLERVSVKPYSLRRAKST